MKRFYKMTAISLAGAGALAIAAFPGFASGEPEDAGAVAPIHTPQDMMGPGFGGQEMMNLGMMGLGVVVPGMIVPGITGPAMMGPAMMDFAMAPTARADLNLSVDDVRGRLGQSLTWRGNKRIKVGAVKAVDDNIIVADIVTQDGSLVQRFEVNRHTGRMLQAE